MPDIIICSNFDVKKLMSLGYMRGQILGSPIEMAGHPYKVLHYHAACDNNSKQEVFSKIRNYKSRS